MAIYFYYKKETKYDKFIRGERLLEIEIYFSKYFPIFSFDFKIIMMIPVIINKSFTA